MSVLVSLLYGHGNVQQISESFWQSLGKLMDTKIPMVLVSGVSIFVGSARLIVR